MVSEVTFMTQEELREKYRDGVYRDYLDVTDGEHFPSHGTQLRLFETRPQTSEGGYRPHSWFLDGSNSVAEPA